MAKFKPARGGKKKPKSSVRAAIPCLILIISAMALMYLLFVSVLKPV